MRWLLLIPVLLVFCLAINAQRPRLSDVTPNDHAKLAVDFLIKIPHEDRQYIRFLSYYNFQNDPNLDRIVKVTRFWINSIHKESDVEFPKEVPNSNGLLYFVDLRDYNWNSTAWSSVANREPYFVEPMINSAQAIALRAISNVTQNKESKDQKGNRIFPFHCDSIVRADWFIRDTSEQDRSDSYFDLLFAKERFISTKQITKKKVEVNWKGGKWNDKDLPAGKYFYETEDVKFNNANINFPKDEKDFEKVFGVDLTLDFIKKSGLNLQRGAVVEGAEKGVSIVARNNRLIQRTYGPIGWYYKTFDVKDTDGRRDFAETLNKDFDFDAGEILARLPGGGQAGLLVDSAGKILTVADNKIAHDSSDFKFDTRVRNVTSCVICHSSGIIKPQNLVEEMLKAGVDIKFKDKKDARDARSFFLNWGKKLTTDQEEFQEFIQRTSGYKPQENSTNFKAVRDNYDSPVTAQTAANEVALSLDMFRMIAARSTKARVLMLVQNLAIPRKSWEIDGYYEVIKLLNADKR